MIRKSISCASLLLLLSQPASASIGKTTISCTAGEKSQTDAIEERDLSGSYKFNKYGINVKAQPQEDFYYRLGYSFYKKDFDAAHSDLDNKTDTTGLYIKLPLFKSNENSLNLNGSYNLRTKRYKDSPPLEYDRNKLSAGVDFDFADAYSLEFSGGINDYEYIKNSSSDQLKSFLKIAPSLKDKHLAVSGHYKKEWVDQTEDKKDYTEDSVSIRTALNLNQLPSPLWGEGKGEGHGIPFLYKLKGRFGYGRNDTRDSDEDREDNLRFKYSTWDTAGYFKLHQKVDTQLAYGQTERTYFTSVNSHDNWFIKNKSSFELIKKDPFNLDLILEGEHKETRFYENESLSYKKNSLSGGFNMGKRANWSFKPGLKHTRYDYPPGSAKNEKQYKLNLSFKKYLGSTDQAVEADYWYKWKDYRYKPDIEQWALSLSFALQF